MKITHEEAIEGSAGTAVRLGFTLSDTDLNDISATLGMWFLTCPGQSPAWYHFMISCIHLREIEGVKAAHLEFPEATHEFLLLALDPSLNPEPTKPKTWQYLRPVNFVGQYALDNDDQAVHLLNMAARAVATGYLWAEPPLSGQREPWDITMRQFIHDLRAGDSRG